MRPRGIESWNATPFPEVLSEGVPPEVVKELNAELHRLVVETEALWNSFWTCNRDRLINDALVKSCNTLIQFYKDLEDAGIKHHIDPAILEKASDEYWIACELLGKVIK